jgi:hypothetical protein
MGIYHCLSCDFERDLNTEDPKQTEGGIGAVLFAGAGFLITCMLVL